MKHFDGPTLIRIRTAAGMEPVELARRLTKLTGRRINSGQVVAWEAGKATPATCNLEALAHVFGDRFDQFFVRPRRGANPDRG